MKEKKKYSKPLMAFEAIETQDSIAVCQGQWVPEGWSTQITGYKAGDYQGIATIQTSGGGIYVDLDGDKMVSIGEFLGGYSSGASMVITAYAGHSRQTLVENTIFKHAYVSTEPYANYPTGTRYDDTSKFVMSASFSQATEWAISYINGNYYAWVDLYEMKPIKEQVFHEGYWTDSRSS